MNSSSPLSEIVQECNSAAQEIDAAESSSQLDEARQHVHKAVEAIEDMRYDLGKLMEREHSYDITMHLDSSLLLRALAYVLRINESEGEEAWQRIRAMKDEVVQAMYHLHDALNLSGTPMET